MEISKLRGCVARMVFLGMVMKVKVQLGCLVLGGKELRKCHKKVLRDHI